MNRTSGGSVRSRLGWILSAILLALLCGTPLRAQHSSAATTAATDKDSPAKAAAPSSTAAPVAAGTAAPAAASGSGQISESQLAGLPLNGRSYSSLATLQAGVSDSSAGSSSRGVSGGNLTVAGGRSTSNNFLLDGTNIMDVENNAPRSAAGVQLGSDAVLQVQVFSTNYAAEYGRGSGGVLNSISRSGGSEMHGTFFEYFRNSKMDTRNFFDGAAPPPFKRNQFGGTVTGPVLKGRTFFMGAFEVMKDRLSTTDVSFLPDAAARAGFPDANGVPTVPVDPRVKPYLALYPLPNGLSIGRGVAQNLHSQFLPTNEYYFTTRVDQRISDRDSFFAHYTFDDASSVSAQDTYLFQLLTESRNQYLTLVGTHIFSARTLLAVSAAYTRPVNNSFSLDNLGVPEELFFIRPAPAFGQIQVPGLSNLGPETTIHRGHIMNSFQYGADAILQRGRHSVKTGLEFHRYRYNVDSDFDKGGVWGFNSLDNFLQAGPVGTNVGGTMLGGDNLHALRQNLLAAYVQDEFRATSRLSFSAGLRYEFSSNMIDNLNRISFMPDIWHDTQVQLGRYFKSNPSKFNFAPRLGFNWSPRAASATVIIGGFGIHYDQILGFVANNRKNSLPFQHVLVNPNAELAQRYFPDAILAAGDVPGQVQVIDYLHSKTPMVLRDSLTIQQRLAGGWRVQAAYVGARGNRLIRRFESNQFPFPEIHADGSLFFPAQCPALPEAPIDRCRPYARSINPLFGSISNMTTDGQSFYNSLQLTANKNLSRGLSLQATYSYSKSVDDNSTGNTTNFGQYAWLRTVDRGPSDFDIRQRFSMNYFYSLPNMDTKNARLAKRLAGQALGGWRLGGIVSIRTGTQFSPQASVRYKNYTFSASRPNLNQGQSNNPTKGVTAGCGRNADGSFVIAPGQKLGTPERYFDPCVFTAAAPGLLGNAGRNTILAPRIFSMDVSLQKEFLLDSKRRLQFRAEIFNLPNHTNFGAVQGGSANVVSGQNGSYTSRTGRITQTNTTSRQLQFALRLSF